METSHHNTSESNSPPHSLKAHRSEGRVGSRRSKDHHLRTSATSPPPPPPPPPLLPSATHSCDNNASPSAEELNSRVSISQNDECMPMRPQSMGQECASASICERGIGCEESSGKGCSLPKRASGCEKFVSMQSLASVRERSADTERVLERDSDNIARVHVGKRGRTDYHHSKGNIAEQSIKSALKDKLDVNGMMVSIAARKGSGSDKKNRGNGDDHFHKTACTQAEPMGAVDRHGLSEGKNAPKTSPRSADHGGDREPPREKKDVSVGRLPLKRAFKTMRALTDLGNSRDFTVKEPEHGSSVGGENMGYREKRSPSQSSGGAAECEKDLHVHSTDVHDFPIKFSHISKRARSHRDRRSHEKLASTGGYQEDGGVKLEEAGKKEEFLVSEVGGERNSTTDSDGEARACREDDGGASSKGADATEELPTKKEEGSMEDSFSTCLYSDEVKDSIERREVHMKSEDHLVNSTEQHATVWDRARNRDFNVQDNINCNVGMTVGIDPPAEMSREASAKESHEIRHMVVSHEDGGNLHRGCDCRGHTMVHAARGEQGYRRVESTACAFDTSLAMEMFETSQGESPLKFLDEGPLGQKNHAHQCPVDGELDTGKQLTLSLFAKGTEAQGEVKGLTMKGDLEREKHLQSALNGGVDGSGGNLGEHVGYGTTEKPSKVGSFLLSLALPGTSTAGEGSYASNAKDLVAPERSSQSLTHTHTRTYTQPHTHNFSQSQSHTRNFSQSLTCTNSDGFTTSLSFSQSLLHNPSCSLNCASVENQEPSCGGSRQIFQGNENFSQRSWQTASVNEHHGVLNLSHDGSRRRPLYPWALENGNKHGFPSASGQKAQVDSKMLDLCSQDLEGFASPSKDLAGRCSQEEDTAWRFSAGRQTQSEPIRQREREKGLCHPASPARKNHEDARGDYHINGGKIGLQEIATEPVAVMAQMMQELPDSFLEGLKALAKDLLGSFEKREEFLHLQNIVKSRTDLTEHTLLHAHRTQLEILVAFKTGVQDFVQEAAKPLTYKVLTEIFLQTRCRNITCQQSLPVDGCECKICSQKGGFCYECMCVVCSKFDSDNHTCRWVGCDVCMHWCHSDCGLRMSYVAPAQSNEGAAGGTEMQYQCVACGHHAELFGFVKKVFNQFADSWGAEILTRELDCVRRIFHGSEDLKGRKLCRKVEEMLQKLEKNVETAEVRRTILQYFNEVNADWDGVGTTANKQSISAKTHVATNRMPMAAQAATQVAPRVGNKDVNTAHLMLQSSVREIFTEKIHEMPVLRVEKVRKQAEIDDIHTRVRNKQAEANMLQRRADEAHQEAKGLQQIIIVKHKMIEDDYVCKYGKLRLKEAEEKNRKRSLELQALERAHLDYEKMKLRMEAQIKDLAIKMEMANWQYA